MAPAQCFEPPALAAGRRLWGVAVQLYTLRSPSNWGIGDFDDLATVIHGCAAHGADFVGLNPLHALFAADPARFSPYSPSSRHFLNVFNIAVPSVDGFTDGAVQSVVDTREFRDELERLRQTDRVDYAGVAAVKLRVLRILFGVFRERELERSSPRARAFRRFRRERGRPLELHALHEAIDTRLRAEDAKYWGWPAWPERLRDPRSAEAREFARQNAPEVDFHAWLQWVADEQLGAAQALARDRGMAIGLYGDYAVGVDPTGSETWSDQRVYRMAAGVGAPPDALALKGQDWGIPPQDPRVLATDSYRPFRQLIAANMRRFGALRIDHVMALFRQWWVPRGFGATEGGYVHYPLDDLMSVLALESVRHRCLVVGEDLGTVPDEIRRAMEEYAAYHYKVLLFEKDRDGRFLRPNEYVRRSIATVTTHDLPTLRGYWEGRDLELREQLNLFPGDEIRRQLIAERERDRAQLLIALGETGVLPAGVEPGAPYTVALGRAVQAYLAKSAAALVVVQFEDLVGMTDPVNVPGTSVEHANWQRKMVVDLDAIFSSEAVTSQFTAVARERPA
jgi:4-alpha-glucanotransferase